MVRRFKFPKFRRPNFKSVIGLPVNVLKKTICLLKNIFGRVVRIFNRNLGNKIINSGRRGWSGSGSRGGLEGKVSPSSKGINDVFKKTGSKKRINDVRVSKSLGLKELTKGLRKKI